MELESPDWERSPSLIEEVQTDPYTTPVPKQQEIQLKDVKLEDVDQEDTTTTPAVLTKPLASNSPKPPPPPKTPPVPPPTHRNRSTRTTARSAQQPHPKTRQTDTKPPPSPSTSKSSEDPVILTTNVPILKKSRPGQPPDRLSPETHPPSTPIVPPPSLARSLIHSSSSSSNLNPPTSPTHRQIQVRIPRPRCHGKIIPFNFSDHILQHLDSTNTSSTCAANASPLPPQDTSRPPCPAPPPALFPPLPPIPNLHLTDQQANNLTNAILRIARSAAVAATNMTMS